MKISRHGQSCCAIDAIVEWWRGEPMKIGLSLGLAVVLVADPAIADTWQTMPALMPSSPSTCTYMASVYELSADGSVFKGTSPSGRPFQSTVAADGTVTLQYGPSTISGNVRSKQFTMVGEKGCRWDLVPFVPIAAQITPGGEWTIGRWEGTISKVGNSGGGSGLQSDPRTLIIQRNANGILVCSFAEPQWAARTPMKSCMIGTDTISMVTYASSAIELSRSGTDGLVGTFIVSAANRTKVFLNRSR
jgi:hypothetical protein